MKSNLWVHWVTILLAAGTASFIGMICRLLIEKSQQNLTESIDEFQLVAFLNNNVSLETSRQLEEKLLQIPEIRGVRFVSKNNALAQLRRDSNHQGKELLLLGENPLPHSFLIKMEAPIVDSRVAAMVQKISSLEEISEVLFEKERIPAIQDWSLVAHLLDIGWVFSWLCVGGIAFLIFFHLLLDDKIGQGRWLLASCLSTLGSLIGLSLYWALASPWEKMATRNWVTSVALGIFLGWSLEGFSWLRTPRAAER